MRVGSLVLFLIALLPTVAATEWYNNATFPEPGQWLVTVIVNCPSPNLCECSLYRFQAWEPTMIWSVAAAGSYTFPLTVNDTQYLFRTHPTPDWRYWVSLVVGLTFIFTYTLWFRGDKCLLTA